MHRSARCVAYKPNSLTDTSSCSAVVEELLLLVNKAGFCNCNLQGWHSIERHDLHDIKPLSCISLYLQALCMHVYTIFTADC